MDLLQISIVATPRLSYVNSYKNTSLNNIHYGVFNGKSANLRPSFFAGITHKSPAAGESQRRIHNARRCSTLCWNHLNHTLSCVDLRTSILMKQEESYMAPVIWKALASAHHFLTAGWWVRSDEHLNSIGWCSHIMSTASHIDRHIKNTIVVCCDWKIR